MAVLDGVRDEKRKKKVSVGIRSWEKICSWFDRNELRLCRLT